MCTSLLLFRIWSTMARRMPEARAADAAVATRAGLTSPMRVPQLMRAAYGEGFTPALIAMLRLPWARVHSAFWNYAQYGRKYGATAAGETAWVGESVAAFRRCEANFTSEACALRFESLSRDNEEVFYHCDQVRPHTPL
jgi:N-acetylgalactosamine 4-sulfate 6-O-sulfotransferase